MIAVQKYGGSSVANKDKILNVAMGIIDTYKKNHAVVVVLSAMGKTTDNLINQALEIASDCSKRELDMLLSIGEQQSVALMTMAIHSLGYSAVSLNAMGAGINVSCDYGNARIQSINKKRIEAELEKRNIVIVTGFCGINSLGDIATLGRGGSDTTAVALAAALNADVCEIYTDVDGIYTGDPRIIKNAKKLNEINYDDMLELASLGAKVLHNRSVELAKKHNVKLVVRSSLVHMPGTIVKETSMEKMVVQGIALDKNIAQITIIGIKDVPGIHFKVFSVLAKKNIMVDTIVQSATNSTLKDISFTVATSDVEKTLAVLDDNKDFLAYNSVNHKKDLVKLSAVGAGMASSPGIAAAMFEALYDVGVNIILISTSETKISVLIDEKYAEVAANSVHDRVISGL